MGTDRGNVRHEKMGLWLDGKPYDYHGNEITPGQVIGSDKNGVGEYFHMRGFIVALSRRLTGDKVWIYDPYLEQRDAEKWFLATGDENNSWIEIRRLP